VYKRFGSHGTKDNMKVLLCIISYLVLLLGGQLLWKKGIGLLPQAFQGSLLTTVIHLVGSGYIIAGLVAYAIATLVWLYLLSVYDLSYIYPITSRVRFELYLSYDEPVFCPDRLRILPYTGRSCDLE
jgi:hypothetical protein